MTIESEKLEGVTIFSNIEYPPSASVDFLQKDGHVGEPDYVFKMFRRFGKIGLHTVDSRVGWQGSQRFLNDSVLHVIWRYVMPIY